MFVDQRYNDPFDQMMDIACGLPELFEGIVTSLNEDDNPQSRKTMFDDQLSLKSRQISASQNTLRSASPTPLYSAIPSSSTNPSDEEFGFKLFPFVLTFQSLRYASYFVLSWAFQLHICMLRMRLIGRYKDIVDSTFEHGRLDSEAKTLLRTLCQSVEYCHKADMGVVGPQAMLYARWVMNRYCEQSILSRELLWCRNIPHMRGRSAVYDIRLMTLQGS